MMDWKNRALFEVMNAQYDPDYRPRYRVPARKWWQLWLPKWREMEGVSTNDVARAHGLEPLPSRLVKVSWN